MTCKEYLLQFKRRQKSISILQEEISTLSGCSAIRYDKPSVKSSPTADGVTNTVAKLMIIRGEYEKQITDYLFERTRFLNDVRYMPNETQGDVLRLMYMNGLSLKDTAKELGYSVSRVAHIHGHALVEYEKLYLISGADGTLFHK